MGETILLVILITGMILILMSLCETRIRMTTAEGRIEKLLTERRVDLMCQRSNADLQDENWAIKVYLGIETIRVAEHLQATHKKKEKK